MHLNLRVPDSIYTPAHQRLVANLRERREKAGLTQVELAVRLGKPQSYVSKYEGGQRRLDLVELREVGRALGTSATSIVRAWEAGL